MALIKHTSFNGITSAADLVSKLGFFSQLNLSIATLDNNAAIAWSSSGSLIFGFGSDVQSKVLIFGFHILNPKLDSQFFELLNGYANSDLSLTQIYLKINSAKKLQVVAGSVVLGTSTTEVANGSKHFVEFKVFVANTGGHCTVKINGVTEISVSIVDTQGYSQSPVNYCRFMQTASSSLKIQNFYIADTTGSQHNDFLGEVVSLPVSVNGDNSIQWLNQSGGSASYTNIAETLGSPNLTDYNESATSGNKDKYTLSDVSALQVSCLTLYATMQKSDVNVLQAAIGTEVSGVAQETTLTPGINWAVYSAMFTTKDGTNAWTPADFNNALATVKVV